MKKKLMLIPLILFILGGCVQKNKDYLELELFSQKVEVHDFLEKIASEFNDENPNIKIKITSLNDAETILRTRMTNKDDSPHIINTKPAYGEFREWSKEERFVDLSNTEARRRLIDGQAEEYQVEDKIYAIPFTTNVSGYYYNVDKFKELGLKVPNNWSEMEELVFTIKEMGYNPFALSLTSDDSWILDGIHQMIWNAVAGYEKTQDILINSKKDEISASNPYMQKVMKALRLFSPENAQDNSQGATYSDGLAAFVNEEALILPHGSWAITGIRELEPTFQVSMFGQPKVNENGHLTMGGPDFSLSVSADKSLEEQEVAIKFIDFFSSKSVIERYHRYEGSPLFVKDVQTKGVNPELEEVEKLISNNEYDVWFTSEWPPGPEWALATVNYIVTNDEEQFEKALNNFFNEVK